MAESYRELVRSSRKLKILKLLSKGETMYTNQTARLIGVAWITTDLLLKELVDENLVVGNKHDGYSIPKERVVRKSGRRSIFEKAKNLLRA